MATSLAEHNSLNLSTVDMGLQVSSKVLPKIFTKIAYAKGYMVHDTYSAYAENSLDILIPTFERPDGGFENIRAGLPESGTYDPFKKDASEVKLTYNHLSIDYEYRKPIKIAEAQIVQNVNGDKVISTMTDYVSKIVAEDINILTAQAIYNAVVAYDSGLTKKVVKLSVEPNGPSIPDNIAELISKIGNADITKGDSSFNDEPMSQVISNTLYAKLMSTKNQFILDSSYGQEILIDGTLGRITLGNVYAYKGKVLGVHTFVLPDAFFPAQENASPKFTNNPSAGKVLGIMGVAVATERAFIDKGIKVTDAQDFRGWMLQPLYRLGVTCLKPWGCGLIVSNDFAI